MTKDAYSLKGKIGVIYPALIMALALALCCSTGYAASLEKDLQDLMAAQRLVNEKNVLIKEYLDKGRFNEAAYEVDELATICETIVYRMNQHDLSPLSARDRQEVTSWVNQFNNMASKLRQYASQLRRQAAEARRKK
jgi:hypothetical protein